MILLSLIEISLDPDNKFVEREAYFCVLNVAPFGFPYSVFLLLFFSVGTIHLFHFSWHSYLLLTEFGGRTVSYGPSFFLFAYGPSAKRAGHKLK